MSTIRTNAILDSAGGNTATINGTIPQPNLGFTPVQQGGATNMGANKVYAGWRTDSTGLQVQVDGTVLGRVVHNTSTTFTSGIRQSVELSAPGDAPLYACRAWVNFNGTGTVAIRAAGNVTSITDVAVGQYAVNFTTAMPDTNYAVVTGTANDSTATNFGYAGAVPVSTSQARIGNWVGAFADASTVSVSILR